MSAQTNNQSELTNKVDEFLEYLQVTKGASPLTIRNYKHYLNRFANYLYKEGYGQSVKSITAKSIYAYRGYLARLKTKEGQLSRKTQAYHIIAIRSLLRWLAKNGHEVISADSLELPKISDRQIKFMTGEQVDKLLNSPTLSTPDGIRDKAILEVLFSTGLRVSELTSLNRDKINLNTREFGVLGKGGRARVVFLSQRATDWVKKYLSVREDHFKPLFIRHKGKVDPTTADEKMRLTPRSVQRMLKKYVKKVKLPVDATPHTIRHSFATDLLMAGADLRSVQEMLGHKNVATTQVYTHVTHKHLKDVHSVFHDKGGS